MSTHASQAQSLPGEDSTSAPTLHVRTSPREEPMKSPRDIGPRDHWSDWPAWTNNVRYAPTRKGGE